MPISINDLTKETKEIQQNPKFSIPEDIGKLPKATEWAKFLVLLKLNSNVLEQKAEKGVLERGKLRLLLICKLTPKLGLIPLRWANNNETKKHLKDDVRIIFGEEGNNKNFRDLIYHYKRLKRALKTPERVTIEVNGHSEDVELPSGFREYRKKVAGESVKARQIFEELSSDENNQRRKEFYVKTCKEAELPMEYAVMQSRVGEIIQDIPANDSFFADRARLSANIKVLNDDIVQSFDEDARLTFYFLKLFRNNTISTDYIPPGGGFVIGQYLSLFSLPLNVQKLTERLGALGDNIFLTEETKQSFIDKIKELKGESEKLITQNPEKRESAYFGIHLPNDEGAVGTISSETSDVNAGKRSRSSSSPPTSTASGQPVNSESKRKSWRKSFGGFSRDKAEDGATSTQASDRKSRRLSLDLRRKSRRLSETFSRTYLLRELSRLALTHDEKKWMPVVDRLIKNPPDGKSSEEYKKEVEGRAAFFQFKDNEKSSIEECFDAVKKYKEKGHGSSDLPEDTLRFFQKVYSAKDFDDFASIVFNLYYNPENRESWKDIKKFLSVHCFNIGTDILESKSSGEKTITVSYNMPRISGVDFLKVGDNIPVEMKTMDLIVPLDFVGLRDYTLKKIRELFNRTDTVLWPNMMKIVKYLKLLLPEDKYKKEVEDNLSIIKSSILYGADNKNKIIVLWRNLFDGDTTLKEAVYTQIVKNGSQDAIVVNDCKGDMKTILQFIWMVCVNYRSDIFEARYNAWKKHFEELQDKAEQQIDISPGVGSGMTLDDDDEESATPPPIPPDDDEESATPPPIPPDDDEESATPPPIPQDDDEESATPPPIPPDDDEEEPATPPPIPPDDDEEEAATPPPTLPPEAAKLWEKGNPDEDTPKTAKENGQMSGSVRDKVRKFENMKNAGRSR